MGKRAKTQHSLEPGVRLGKYELLSPLAVGGMAELYLARSKSIEGFEKLVVLKRILPNYAESDTFVKMFLNEARLSATLLHPNIAQVYDIGTFEESFFFTMEYVPGPDLRAVLKRRRESDGGRIPLETSAAIIISMAEGLHYAHEKKGPDGKPLGIVHRDVSPSNVLLTAEGAVKVVDFGIAKAAARGGSGTATGSLKGKVAYMSPEQCRGEKTLDRRSDIFSLGIILYELSTGTRLYKRDTQFKTINDIVWEDVTPPSKLVDDYPEQLEKIVMRALAKEPDERYQTAKQISREITAFAREARLMPTAMSISTLLEGVFGDELESWQRIQMPSGGTLTATASSALVHDMPSAEDNSAPSKTSSIFAGQAAGGSFTRISRDSLIRYAKIAGVALGLLLLFYIGLTDDSISSIESMPAATPVEQPKLEVEESAAAPEPDPGEIEMIPDEEPTDETSRAPANKRKSRTKVAAPAAGSEATDDEEEWDEVGDVGGDGEQVEPVEGDTGDEVVGASGAADDDRIDIDSARLSEPKSSSKKKSKRSHSKTSSHPKNKKWDPSSPFLPPPK